MNPAENNTPIAAQFFGASPTLLELCVFCHSSEEENQWSLYLYGEERQDIFRLSMTPRASRWGLLSITHETEERPAQTLKESMMHPLRHVTVGEIIRVRSQGKVLNYQQHSPTDRFNFWM